MRLGLAIVLCGVLVASPVVVHAAPKKKKQRAQDLIAKSEHLSPADEKASFDLPPGFEAQLVAAEPDINKPMNIAFDDRGRLWVSSTVEYPFPAPADRKPRDSIKILQDFDENGR